MIPLELVLNWDDFLKLFNIQFSVQTCGLVGYFSMTDTRAWLCKEVLKMPSVTIPVGAGSLWQ